jgi:hypothetical protein
MGDFLAKLIPKFPDFAFAYWDCFLGLCFVLAPLLRGDQITTKNVFLPFGFGLICLSMARRNWTYVGRVRLLESAWAEASFGHKIQLAYPKIIWASLWSAAFVICMHYSARNFGIAAPWVRWILRY